MTTANRLPTLFDLGDAENALLALLEEHDSDAPEVVEHLALFDQMIAEKTENYVSVIRTFESMAEARKAEADRMAARAKTAQRHADWLRDRLLVHIQSTGREHVETSRFTLSVRTNPPSVVVLDASAVPGEYQRTRIDISVDKRLVLEHFKATGEIPAGIDVQHGKRLEVK